MSITRCAFCDHELELKGMVSRNDTCPECGRDLHSCLQCKFYDPGSYNECKETSADRVVDKERANFCDYFILKGAKEMGFGREAAAKQALEDLFRKKED
jgi:hypothetical protein